MRVAICVPTHLRPHGLARLLLGLDALTFDKVDPPAIQVVVVDNDPQGSASEVCQELAPTLRWPLRYAHEPRRGVTYARNTAVACGREWGEFIAFIDDDEVPEPRWLDELLHVQSTYDADVVSGPVIRRFESGVPDWVSRGRFFEFERYPTGFRVEDPGAGNTLLRLAALAGQEEPFDHRFALTGGEDTHLFLRLGRAGCTMVWADDAVTYEWVPSTRARARWILQRVFRTASTWSICEREIRPSSATAAVRAAKGVARITYGLFLLPFVWPFGRHRVVRSLWYVCWGAGNLTGLANLSHSEYRTTHGR
jgi:succinoglycan biosynthesis protein ExoM